MAWMRNQKATREMWYTYDAAVVKAMRDAGQTVWVWTPEGFEKGDGKIVRHLGTDERGGTMTDFIWCVACGGEIEPDDEGEYLYCEWCDDGPFCESCLNDHECDEEDDARD
jgi:hypothetical protein